MGVRSLRPVIGRRLLRTHSLSIRRDIEVRQTPGAHIWRRSAAWAKPSPLVNSGQSWSALDISRHLKTRPEGVRTCRVRCRSMYA